MINLSDYLDPVSIDKQEIELIAEQSQFSRNLVVHTENNPVASLKGFRVAILGVPDDRLSPERGSASAPDEVRKALYPMARIPGKIKIADLGNLKTGVNYNDTIAGLADVLYYLADYDILTVIIGGSGSLIQAVDRFYQTAGRSYQLTTIDSRIDFHPESREYGSVNSLFPLLQSARSKLSHFINIGYQTYLNDPQVVTRLSRRQFELVRLGEVRQAIHLTEPLFRDSEAINFDIGAVRYADAPGSYLPSPNGLYSEEACLLARYAGVSDKMKYFSLVEINPAKDRSQQTASLGAQIIWFLLESHAQRQSENPAGNAEGSGRFTRYHINVDDLGEEMIFVKSNFTERWWIELTAPGGKNHYVACSYEDYLRANNNEVPDRWIRANSRFKQ
ncbi:MAG: arginase family protein [Bacteroidales bacterium]|nr:arginase family protein [Bacteroidales bacterium]